MIRSVCHKLYGLIHPVLISGDRNTCDIQSKRGLRFYVHIKGDDNTVNIGKDCQLCNTSIQISGCNNHIWIDDNVRFMGPCKIIMEGCASLRIRWNAGIRGVDFILKDANIDVGELCMFSYGITVRNHDSHKILNPETKEIMNLPKDIVLGNHVWIGQNATILKGCHIGDNSVIGFGSIVTKSCSPGSLMIGVPAKVMKEGITWDY